jgi:hypothetical protein
VGDARRTGQLSSGLRSACEVGVSALDNGCDGHVLGGLNRQITCRHLNGQNFGHLASCLLQTGGPLGEGAENGVHVVKSAGPWVDGDVIQFADREKRARRSVAERRWSSPSALAGHRDEYDLLFLTHAVPSTSPRAAPPAMVGLIRCL